MKLAGIVGQDRALGVLRESIARGRLHHALLFAGPEGVGKFTTATALAARLFCLTRADDACGRCDACAQVAAESHPDLHVERLEKNEKGKLRQNVSIDQVRGLQVALSRAPLGGLRKIAIVDQAETLSEAAQNAFLKTLEEPPGNALIVLVASNAGALIPTVRSRCQRIPFSPLPDETIERLLRESHGRSPQDARRLAAYAGGSLGLALATDAVALAEAEERLEGILDGWKGRGHAEVLAAVEALAAQSEPLGLELLLHLLRRRLRRAAGVAPAGAAAEGELTPPAKTGTLLEVLRAAEHAYRASVDLERNANPSIALERMWLGIGETLADAG